MTPRDREFVAGLCADRAGLGIEPSRVYLFESALSPVARREGYFSVAELVRAVRDRGDDRLVSAVVEAMAPAQTAFFRDGPVFEWIREWLKLCAAERRPEPLRIWSAGCGSGQEPYSLAMLADELAVLGLDVQVFASDLSERHLEKGQAGLYSAFEVQRGLSARRLVRHFENRGEAFALSPRLRQMVRWRKLNLLDDLSRVGRYDLVLCRHVLGDMLPAARERTLAGLVGAVGPVGRLVLGPDDAPALTTFGLEPTPGAPGAYSLSSPVAAAA